MGSQADTIAALATPEGAGLRALVRLSGPAARAIVEGLCEKTLRDREPVAAKIPIGEASIPATFVLFAAPRSYTREDVVEISMPSSPPLLQSLMRCLVEEGARMAEPGEFTRRAFLHGRIDLSRAEGVLELVSARNERQAKAGLLLLEGGLAERVASMRRGLENALAQIEASLDFEEADTGHIDAASLLAQLREAANGLEEAAQWETRRLAPRGEFRVFLWGEPNAGKSSLLNRLDPQARAIVSPIAGTTRDGLRGKLRAGELEIEIFDAAGMETGLDPFATRAQDLARRFRESADAVIGVADVTKDLPGFFREAKLDLLVLNKCDLVSQEREAESLLSVPSLRVSAQTGEGVEALRAAILELTRGGQETEGERMGLAQRHREAMARAAREVEQSKKMLASDSALDVVASHLRQALAALGEIDGTTTPEDILDRIFSQFCIGK